jgi:hypothetical protein
MEKTARYVSIINDLIEIISIFLIVKIWCNRNARMEKYNGRFAYCIIGFR